MDKRKVRSKNVKVKEDRLSSLPDELIHRILSFVDIRKAVQTSILSNRWKAIWTTLPSLKFAKFTLDINYIDKFLTHRNHQSEVFELDLAFTSDPSSFFTKFVSYAILHNVQHLKLYFYSGVDAVKLSTLASTSLKKLTLEFRNICKVLESGCWNLPALTTLHLIETKYGCTYFNDCNLYLKCLTSLQSLLLDGFELPTSISLPTLTNLHLKSCKLPQNVWEFPALLTLKLEGVGFPENMSDFLSVLINLQNLTLSIGRDLTGDLIIDCPQLVNLKIRTYFSFVRKIMVFAPKIRNFSSVGFFSITFGVCQLENVDIKLLREIRYKKKYRLLKSLKTDYHRVTHMFPGLGSARILTLDSDTIEALSYVSDFLVNSPCPFYNLKYVKVPLGYKVSSISTNLRCYLLGRSPKATIVTKLPQDEMIPQMFPVCRPALNMLSQNPLSTPVAQSGSSCTQVSLTRSDLGLWQGHEVKLEFLGLLDSIAKKYPETFDRFTSNSKKLCTMKLNMLCTTVEAFTKTSRTDMDAEIIAEYRALFADMQRSFNVQWLVNRLNDIEQLKLSEAKLHAVDSSIDDARIKVDDARIKVDDARSKFDDAKGKLDDAQSKLDDAKTELQDLQALQMSMITKIHEDIGNMGATSLGAGYVGDNLFSVT